MIFNSKRQFYFLCKFFTVFAFVLVSSCAGYLDKKTVSILQAIASKNSEIKSYKADFEMVMLENGKKNIIEGKILFKQPNLTRQETKLSSKSIESDLIISNGKIKWIYIPSAKIAFQEEIKTAQLELQKKYGLVSAYVDIKSLHYIKTDIFNAQPVFVLEGRPNKVVSKRDLEAPKKFKIFISTERGIVLKIASYDKDEEEIMSQVFNNFNFNIKIPDGAFSFVLPDGVQVIKVTGTHTN